MIKFTIKYKDGKREGEKISYYKFGGIEKRSNYKNDKLEGWVTKYSKQGDILSKELYKSGSVVKSD